MMSMNTLSFRQLPLIVKIAVGIVFNNAWWSIEEFVIDRRGLWKYMPYYRVANPCVWDLIVAWLQFSSSGTYLGEAITLIHRLADRYRGKDSQYVHDPNSSTATPRWRTP